MVPAPPWHFSGDALWITFRADPSAVTALLPDGLSPGPDPGFAAIGFYDWQWCTDSGAELQDPVRAQFRECMIALDCQLGDRPVARVPYAWVDSAVPLIRGFIQGMPKLPGAVWLTRSFAVGRAGPRRAVGSRFSAVASSGGRRLLTAAVTLESAQDTAPTLADRPLVHTRHFPAWQAGEAPLEELAMASTTDTEFAEVWRGEPELVFQDIDDQHLAALAPVELEAGFVFSYAETLWPGSRVGPDIPAGTQ